MKINVERKILSQACTIVGSSVAKNSTIPSLECIHILAEDQHITLTGYDLETGIRRSIPAEIFKNGSITVNAKLFNDIIRKLDCDYVELFVDEKLNINIKGEHSEFLLVGISSDDYPQLPNINEEQDINVSSETLCAMIKQTIFAVAPKTPESKPIYTGIKFEFSNNSLSLIAVDGYRLAIRKETIVSSVETMFIVPADALKELVKIVPDESCDINILVGKNHISFIVGEYIIISRLLTGDFLDYKKSVPDGGTTTVRVKTSDLIGCIDRVSVVINDRFKNPVHCIFDDENIKISSITTIGKAVDDIGCSMTGERVEIGVNFKYFLEALNSAGTDEVLLQLNTSTSPIKIVPTTDDYFCFLVLPVRI